MSTRVEGEAARDVECDRDGGMCAGDGGERIIGGERHARMGLAGCGWESREREGVERARVCEVKNQEVRSTSFYHLHLCPLFIFICITARLTVCG